MVSLLVFRTDGRTPTPQECEDAGEDAGFYEPKFCRLESHGTYKNAQVVTEGFEGKLCKHEMGLSGHFGRNPFGSFWRCKKCGVTISTSQRKGSKHIEYIYGEWSLRHHIWLKWCEKGPVPDSLTVQEHHR